MTVSAIDTAVVVCYIIGVTAFGAWIGRGSSTSADYLLGSRSLPWWAVLGSIVATETSTVTFLSIPGVAFASEGDLTFLQLAMGLIVGRMIVSAFLVPLYFRGELLTAYQVLRKRFGRRTQRTASLLFLMTRNAGDGLRLFLTAIVLEKVAGFSLPVCIAVIGLATIVYTFLGGMKAVVWNDCIQFVVYIAGGVCALLLIISRLDGGWAEFFAWGHARGKFDVFDTSWTLAKPYTLWAGLIGGATLTLGTHGTDQMMVQRYLSSGSRRAAGRAVVLSGFVVFVQFALFLLLGVALAWFYEVDPPPQPFERNDEVLATFIVNRMPVGLTGLTLAAVFSAAMSTLSSSLSASASAVVGDFCSDTTADSRQLQLSRRLTIGFGVIQIAVGIAASFWSRSVVDDALAVAGFASGILLGVFGLGALKSRIPENCVVAAMMLAAVVLLVVHFMKLTAWPWFAPIGAVVTFAAGLICAMLSSAPAGSETQAE